MDTRRFSKIADFFIPTARNGYIPYGMSRATFLVYVTLGLLIMSAGAYMHISQLASPLDIVSFQPFDVIRYVNEARQSVGLEPLIQNPVLAQAAERKAYDMLEHQYFAHISPQGVEPWDFLGRVDYTYMAAGENLAIDFLTAFDAHRALMNSASHRANILNPLYEEVGVAVIPGEFEGRSSIVLVQYFGRPKNATAIALATPVPSPSSTPTQTLTPSPIITQVPAVITEQPVGPTEVPSGMMKITASPIVTVEPMLVAGVSENDAETRQDAVHERHTPGIVASIGNNDPGSDYRDQVKLIALLIIGLSLLPLAFTLTRLSFLHHHPAVYLRPIVVVFLFVYIGWLGGAMDARAPQISPDSAATISLPSS